MDKQSGTGNNLGIGNDDLWILNLKVTAVSPIYTGENKLESQKDRRTGVKLPTRRSGDGYAVVNISGIMRSFDERIYKNEGACDVGKNARGCGRCLICDLYGALGRKGRASVDELKSILPFEKVVMSAKHPRIDRDTGTVPKDDKGATLELEEIQEGTELLGKLLIRFPKERDLEIIESAIKAMEEHGIGGWTRRGKGRVRIESTLEKVKWSDYKEEGKEEAKKLLEKK